MSTSVPKEATIPPTLISGWDRRVSGQWGVEKKGQLSEAARLDERRKGGR